MKQIFGLAVVGIVLVALFAFALMSGQLGAPIRLAVFADPISVCDAAKTWDSATAAKEYNQVLNEISVWSVATLDSVRSLAPSLANADTATLSAKLLEIQNSLTKQRDCILAAHPELATTTSVTLSPPVTTTSTFVPATTQPASAIATPPPAQMDPLLLYGVIAAGLVVAVVFGSMLLKR